MANILLLDNVRVTHTYDIFEAGDIKRGRVSAQLVAPSGSRLNTYRLERSHGLYDGHVLFNRLIEEGRAEPWPDPTVPPDSITR